MWMCRSCGRGSWERTRTGDTSSIMDICERRWGGRVGRLKRVRWGMKTSGIYDFRLTIYELKTQRVPLLANGGIEWAHQGARLGWVFSTIKSWHSYARDCYGT